MAWVRPKHPKPKVVDNTESRKSLLLYFSGQRARPSPPRIDRPVKLDPILQEFAQNKKLAIPTPPQKKKQTPTNRGRPQHVQRPEPVEFVVDYESELDEVEEEPQVQAPPRRVIQQHRYIQAPVSVPRPASPQRTYPRRTIPKVLPRRAPMEWESRERSSWETRSNTSSRWASAVTPLPGLI